MAAAANFMALFLFSCLPLPALVDTAAEGFFHDLSYPVNNSTLDWGGKVFQMNVTQEAVQEGETSYW